MYDVVVIGGGAAAHGAALYAMRYQLQTIMVIEEFGGETATARQSSRTILATYRLTDST